jgi:hypothetical protein
VQRFYKSFRYKAASWSHPRRVVAKVEWHPSELFPRVGFIVDKRMKGRIERDAALVPLVQRERCPPSASCAGI